MHNQKPLVGGIKSDKVIILLHGRGGNAREMLEFADAYLPPAHFIALETDHNEWYPFSITDKIEKDEPHLLASLAAINRAIKETALPYSKINILGFSQGACLSAEFASRHPGKIRKYNCFQWWPSRQKHQSPRRKSRRNSSVLRLFR